MNIYIHVYIYIRKHMDARFGSDLRFRSRICCSKPCVESALQNRYLHCIPRGVIKAGAAVIMVTIPIYFKEPPLTEHLRQRQAAVLNDTRFACWRGTKGLDKEFQPMNCGKK